MKRSLIFSLAMVLRAGDVQSLSCVNKQALPPFGTVNSYANLVVNQPSFFGRLFGKKKITSVVWTVGEGNVASSLEGSNLFTIGNSKPSNIRSVQVNKTTYPVTCK